jgi:quercetin dioxygenase-like cupin family protein
MITRNLADLGAMGNAHGVDARNIYDTDAAVITVITLKPGQSLKRHITPVDVAFYVLEGKGTVEIGEEKQEVGRDTLIESPKDIMHCWYNTSDADLRFMVVKAPRPTRKTAFVGS